jgi:hypothetical protein
VPIATAASAITTATAVRIRRPRPPAQRCDLRLLIQVPHVGLMSARTSCTHVRLAHDHRRTSRWLPGKLLPSYLSVIRYSAHATRLAAVPANLLQISPASEPANPQDGARKSCDPFEHRPTRQTHLNDTTARERAEEFHLVTKAGSLIELRTNQGMIAHLRPAGTSPLDESSWSHSVTDHGSLPACLNSSQVLNPAALAAAASAARPTVSRISK